MRLNDFNEAVAIWGILSLEVVEKIKNEDVFIVVPENRPYLFGLLHNIPLLKKSRIKFVYCTDNMLGFLFYRGKIKKTIIFYKGLTEQGILGVSGTLYIALLSKLHNVSIDIYPQGIFKKDLFDHDASTLAGKSFMINEDKSLLLPALDEMVAWSLLR